MEGNPTSGADLFDMTAEPDMLLIPSRIASLGLSVIV